MTDVTAIVTTFNESQQIGETLKRLDFADEVLVVDSFSTDGTVQTAREQGAKVLQHEYHSPAAQKNWAIARANTEWVLIVDADEWVTPSLAEEIRRTVVGPRAMDGYEIRRRNFFLGREIRHCGWQNDRVLRLFRRARGRYAERQVHEVMQVEGRVGRLREPLVHHSYRSLNDYWKKLRRYADWNAQEASRQGRGVSPLYMVLHPPLRFLKAYLLQGGFLDGAHGLVVCLLTAIYAAAKDINIWELQQRTRPSAGGQLPGGGNGTA